MLPRLTSDQLDPDTNPGLGKSFYYFFKKKKKSPEEIYEDQSLSGLPE